MQRKWNDQDVKYVRCGHLGRKNDKAPDMNRLQCAFPAFRAARQSKYIPCVPRYLLLRQEQVEHPRSGSCLPIRHAGGRINPPGILVSSMSRKNPRYSGNLALQSPAKIHRRRDTGNVNCTGAVPKSDFPTKIASSSLSRCRGPGRQNRNKTGWVILDAEVASTIHLPQPAVLPALLCGHPLTRFYHHCTMPKLLL